MKKRSPCPHHIFREKLRVCSKAGRCNYHIYNEIFYNDTMGPKGLCQDAYHVLYPECLSVLYGGNEILRHIYCPGAGSSVQFSVKVISLGYRFKALNVVKKLLYSIMPSAIFNHGVLIKIESVEGDCPKSHKPGQKYFFPLGNFQLMRNKILSMGSGEFSCPAGFDSLFPYLSWVEKYREFPWGKNTTCPDFRAKLHFTIEKENE